MKTTRLVFVFSILIFFACNSNHKKTETNAVVAEQPQEKVKLKSGEVISSVIAERDPSQSYALYLPKNYSDSVKYPVIIFFDPHGSGRYPLDLYKGFADEFGFVLMGSNNSKNGLQFDQTNVIAKSLVDEAVTKYSSGKKNISLAGFSGGAKVALVAAATQPDLSSVIYCGAAIRFDNINQLPPALAFAGESDMNYTDVISSVPALEEKKMVHSLIEWKGKHEWPDSSSFEDAFYWCSFNAMRNKSREIDNKRIKTFLQKKNKSLTDKQNSLMQYNLYNQIIQFLQGVVDVTAYQQKFLIVKKSDSYKKEMQKQQNGLQTENNLKQNYAQCFESKDLNWWKEEIARMRNIKASDQEKMYQRLLGYLSLASYSYSNNAIKQNNFSAAQQFLAVYKLADPENAEQPFLTACMYARQGDREKAIAALEEALKLGLKDKSKVETEESFRSLHGDAEFNQLLGKM